MGADRAYVDANIFIYLYSDTEPEKRARVLESINKYDRTISTQVLNEFCNVCLRRMNKPKQVVEASVREILATCKLVGISEITVYKALYLHDKYGFSYYDCLMIASALETGCRFLLSEDMAGGQIIEDRLTIKNIFV
jgi:predicted nucleic acid-binding protein